MSHPKLVYMDHAATTPVSIEVLNTMLPYFTESFGNPSSLYPLAIESYKAIEQSRLQVATALNCKINEIVFTSGGTESDNMALRGVTQALKHKGNHIITTPIEHHAILNVCEHLKNNGVEVTYLPVDQHGLVDPKDVYDAVKENTVLVSVMYANNEIGTVEPIDAISDVLRERSVQINRPIPFHTDAVQSATSLDIDVQKLGVDLLSLSAHKFYGPKGCGVLYVKNGTPFEPIQFGGGQEQQRRSGTENVAAIVGCGKALEIASLNRPLFQQQTSKMANSLIEQVLEGLTGVRLTGHPVKRLSNNVHFTFDGIDGEALVLALSKEGIAASTGSACSTGSIEPSHVLESIGIDRDIAWGSLRITLGKDNNEKDIQKVAQSIITMTNKLRSTL